MPNPKNHHHLPTHNLPTIPVSDHHYSLLHNQKNHHNYHYHHLMKKKKRKHKTRSTSCTNPTTRSPPSPCATTSLHQPYAARTVCTATTCSQGGERSLSRERTTRGPGCRRGRSRAKRKSGKRGRCDAGWCGARSPTMTWACCTWHRRATISRLLSRRTWQTRRGNGRIHPRRLGGGRRRKGGGLGVR